MRTTDLQLTAATVLENPFPGLRPFREGEEHLFFGRESQVDHLVDKLAATRFLSVVGTSGTGKSSLVNCGLKPALHRGTMTSVGSTWCIVQFRPGGRPVRSMARAFAEEPTFFCGFEPEGLSLLEIVDATLNMSSLGLADLFEFARFAAGTNLLVVVDQFEELFRYGKTTQSSPDGLSGEAIAFVNLLLEAHTQTRYPIYIVLTMRSDFLGECSQLDRLPEVMNQGQYLVPRLTRDERRQAIAGPISVAAADLSPVLLTRLVNDVGENPDQLSILQHAVNRTWAFWQSDGHGEGCLGLGHYDNEKVGTMSRALDGHAEEAYAALHTASEQKLCAKIFKAITDKGTDARGIRRPMRLKTLCAVTGSTADEVIPILDLFREPSRSFLMPPLAETIDLETVIDISHEILMRVWLRLKAWSDEEASSAATYRRLAETASLHAEKRARLWSDPDLQTALDWKARENPNLAWAGLYRPGFEVAMSFLDASKQVRDRDLAQVEFDRRWRRITPFLAGLLLIIFLSFSARLSDALAPYVRPAVKQVFSHKAEHLSEVIVNGFGFQLAAVICILSYAGLSLGGQLIYRKLVFPTILRQISERPCASETPICLEGSATTPQFGTAIAASASSLAPANLSSMFNSGFIDCLVLISLSITTFIIGLQCAIQFPWGGTVFIAIAYLNPPFWGLFYPSLMVHSRLHRTLGDLVFSIAVTDLQGNPPSFMRMLLRTLSIILSWALLGLGFLMQPFTPGRRTLHDLIAGTTVIQRERTRKVEASTEFSQAAHPMPTA